MDTQEQLQNIQHGTVNGYMNQKCRCEVCREAVRVYLLQWRAKNMAKGLRYDGKPRHKRYSAIAKATIEEAGFTPHPDWT